MAQFICTAIDVEGIKFVILCLLYIPYITVKPIVSLTDISWSASKICNRLKIGHTMTGAFTDLALSTSVQYEGNIMGTR
jgi:hypothetical protein